MKNDQYKSLRDFPAVEILAGHRSLKKYGTKLPRTLLIDAVRDVIENAKAAFREQKVKIDEKYLLAHIKKRIDSIINLHLIPVINGTGIIIHTNLGRAPLARKFFDNIAATVSGYSNLEFDLESGKRGRRGKLVEKLLASLCGTPAAGIVNNNAAALFIILNTFAYRKEVIISRGELVQIGGGFKIPEIMAKSGAKLVEVGTTNRTSLKDYAAAATDRTRMILKVHRSNFTQEGFVEETSLQELARLAKKHNIILTHDLGSGLIELPRGVKIAGEPTVRESVHAGAHLTCFSGDKLLGGTQAGMIAGSDEYISRIKKNPLFRTLRCDKLVFAITAQVLASYLNHQQFDELPVWQMITVPVTELKRRGENILDKINSKEVVLVATKAYLGGGSTPEQGIASLSLSIRTSKNINELSDKFRNCDPPVIGRIAEGAFLLDLRTIPPECDKIIVKAIKSLVS